MGRARAAGDRLRLLAAGVLSLAFIASAAVAATLML
jgi:hypothetical protein